MAPKIKHKNTVRISGRRIFLSLLYSPGETSFHICIVMTGIDNIKPPMMARFNFNMNIP